MMMNKIDTARIMAAIGIFKLNAIIGFIGTLLDFGWPIIATGVCLSPLFYCFCKLLSISQAADKD
jgi:hypothetical protein